MKTKTIFLSLFLTLASLGLWAQEKYELATVSINLQGREIVFLTSSEAIRTPAPKDLPLTTTQLKKVEELIAEGWEIYNTAVVYGANLDPMSIYYLRKKKP